MGILKDLTGQRFGKLVVLKRAKNRENSRSAIWLCKCDCGNHIEKDGHWLRDQPIQTCGCERWKNKTYQGCGNLSKSHWGSILRCAKDRNLKIPITIQDAWELFVSQNGKCALSGLDITLQRNVLDEDTASLDRIDSNKGYEKDNVQWVHKEINRLKRNMHDEDFFNWCKTITDYKNGILPLVIIEPKIEQVVKINPNDFRPQFKYKQYDIVGKKFGKLIVLNRAIRENSHVSYWLCQCDCGKQKEIKGRDLVTGNIKSCNCARNERSFIGKPAHNFSGHGDLSGKYWTQVKRGAIQRNLDFNIKIEDIWDLFLRQNKRCALSGVSIFIDRQKQTASLDRIDSKKGYLIDNVQWVYSELNMMKGVLSLERFFHLCEQVVCNFKKSYKQVA